MEMEIFIENSKTAHMFDFVNDPGVSLQGSSGQVYTSGPGCLSHLHPCVRCCGGHHQLQVSSDRRTYTQETYPQFPERLQEEW